VKGLLVFRLVLDLYAREIPWRGLSTPGGNLGGHLQRGTLAATRVTNLLLERRLQGTRHIACDIWSRLFSRGNAPSLIIQAGGGRLGGGGGLPKKSGGVQGTSRLPFDYSKKRGRRRLLFSFTGQFDVRGGRKENRSVGHFAPSGIHQSLSLKLRMAGLHVIGPDLKPHGKRRRARLPFGPPIHPSDRQNSTNFRSLSGGFRWSVSCLFHAG